jgi:hypothetical protein
MCRRGLVGKSNGFKFQRAWVRFLCVAVSFFIILFTVFSLALLFILFLSSCFLKKKNTEFHVFFAGRVLNRRQQQAKASLLFKKKKLFSYWL